MASKNLIKFKKTVGLIEIKPVRKFAQLFSVPEGFV